MKNLRKNLINASSAVILLTSIIFFSSCEDIFNNNITPMGNNKGTYIFVSGLDHIYGEVYMCDESGKNLTRISNIISNLPDINALDGDNYPVLSPDNKKVAFKSLDNNKLMIYNIDDKTLTNIGKVSFGEESKDVAWSPESDKIAYIEFPSIEYQIIIKSADGELKMKTRYTSSSFPLYDSVIMFKQIAWHEDGKRILVSGIQNGAYHFYEIDVNSGKIIKGHSFPIYGEFFYRNDTVIFQSTSQMYYANLKDGTIKPLFNEIIENFTLSPDGQRLAYTVTRDYTYNGNIYKCGDIMAIGLNGYDKFNLTQTSDIPDESKSSTKKFKPIWISNTELLYAAGNIYLVKDDFKPRASILVKDVKAYGQLQFIKK